MNWVWTSWLASLKVRDVGLISLSYDAQNIGQKVKHEGQCSQKCKSWPETGENDALAEEPNGSMIE